MTFVTRLAAGALTLALLGSAAPAEPLKLSDKESRQVMAAFARCVAKERTDIASKAVIEDWNAEQITGQGSRLLPPVCVRAGGTIAALRFQAPNVRAALAEQLISLDPGLALSAESAARLAPLAYHQPWPITTIDKKGKPLNAKKIEAQQRGFASRVSTIVGQQVGECVIRANPAGVRAIFATRVGSDQELAAFQAISAVMPPCVPAGKQLSFDRNSLRGSLALSYYRLAMASRGVVWAGEARQQPDSDGVE